MCIRDRAKNATKREIGKRTTFFSIDIISSTSFPVSYTHLDAFGRFGSLERTARAPWVPQARRYYYNSIGKYGAQVQALLKKISALEIKTICPLHGPMLTEDLGEYLRLYDLWSQWKPEEPEGILIAHASICLLYTSRCV